MGGFCYVLVSMFKGTRGDTGSPRDPILGLTTIHWAILFFIGLPIGWVLSDKGLVPEGAIVVALFIIIVGSFLASKGKP